ncbi:dihydrofolate reductase [Corynebacterium kroppenstedtii]|uniref:dihydrofolate reductase n=1 Tax=Corynebacterium sp. PCR 32 TaxID=3351342 RepID=UPI0030AA7D86
MSTSSDSCQFNHRAVLPEDPLIGVIWASDRDGVIGDGRRMPWHVPEDMAHFKHLTWGVPVIMGSATWSSIPSRFRPLPGRPNIVLSRRWGDDDVPENVALHRSLESALDTVPRPGFSRRVAPENVDAWIIGGGEVYREALVRSDVRLAVLTEIDASVGRYFETPVTARLPEGWVPSSRTEWKTSHDAEIVGGHVPSEEVSPLRYRFCFFSK